MKRIALLGLVLMLSGCLDFGTTNLYTYTNLDHVSVDLQTQTPVKECPVCQTCQRINSVPYYTPNNFTLFNFTYTEPRGWNPTLTINLTGQERGEDNDNKH
jgi:hypothetical protein